MKYRVLVPVAALLLLSLLVLWPAFGSSSPTWMGAADGFVLAKARFLSDGFGLGSWNRYWFLGIPGQHIGSPVIPWILSLVTGTVPVSQPGGVFGVWRGMVALGVVGSVIGVWWFTQQFFREDIAVGERKKAEFGAIFVAVATLLMPSVLVLFPQIWRVLRGFGWPSWAMFAPFYLGDGQRTLAFGLLIVLLVQAWRLIDRWTIQRAVILSFLIGLLLLVDSLSFLTFILWNAAFLLVTIVVPKMRKTSIIVHTTRLLTVSFFGLLLAGFWFTPGYIYTFLGSPSLGGKPFTVVFITLLRRLLIFMPAIFGVIAARRWLKKTSLVTIVGIMGFFVFGSLTLAAFFADPDFWTDYSRFGRSLDLSVALVVGGIVYSKLRLTIARVAPFVVVLFLSLPFLLGRERLLRGRIDVSDTVEYRVSERLSRLMHEVCDENDACSLRAYLSGSTVFWLNSWFDVVQVRGGGEMGSINDWWPHASFQIREGSRPELAEGWLEAIGVSYLVVHGYGSEEVYHDFRFPSKFEVMESWEKVWEEKGDGIFVGREAMSIARVVDLHLLKLKPPTKGDDLMALRRYRERLGEPAQLRWIGTRELEVSANVEEGQGIRLAVAHSPFWRVADSSVAVEVVKDPLGMIVLRPSRAGTLSIRLGFAPWLDLVGGILFSALALYALLRRPEIVEWTASIAERFVGRESELDRTAL